MDTYNPEEYFFFYSERSPENSVFSNFYPASYSINGIKFKTSEHGFMYDKALTFEDYKIAALILTAKTPRDAKDLGKKVKGFDNSIWNKCKEDIMFKHCYAKFSTIKKLRKELCKTNGLKLTEASPRDRIWGIGFNRKSAPKTHPSKWGKNLLGKTLVKVRNELLKE
jgi:ribA/ribD-fused uncharacterized protein